MLVGVCAALVAAGWILLTANRVDILVPAGPDAWSPDKRRTVIVTRSNTGVGDVCL